MSSQRIVAALKPPAFPVVIDDAPRLQPKDFPMTRLPIASPRRTRAASCLAAATVLALSVISLVGLVQQSAPRVAAAALPTGFTEVQVASGLSNPTAMAFGPSNRLYVAQQGGALRVVRNGALKSTPFVTLGVDSAGERGLLGVAFDPNFASNNFVYVYYTATSPTTHNRISRFTANPTTDVAVAGSEVVIMELPTLSSATNHNGGAMHFGPDGKLYVAVGENANASNAQSLSNVLGKMLRINADGSIPSDNPFFNTTTGQARAIWALGLRNPFTFNFQPGTGRMFINDVGQGAWEEVNDGVRGANYGWPTHEGPETVNDGLTPPLYAYQNDGSTCAITGGVFYNPGVQDYPATYVGKYFFADFCGGWIRLLDSASRTATTFATGISAPVDLQVGPEGNLYYLARGTGSIWRIDHTGSQAPSITQHPQSQAVSVGQPVTFTASASGTAPLAYQWQRNGVNINNATGSSYTIPSVTTSDNGARFRAIVSNAAGSATSNEATLTVTSNQPPTATFATPAAGATYRAGQTVSFSGSGSDPETGALPASAFTWRIVFHHDTHTHPFIESIPGVTSGQFTIPNTGETSTNVFYRIHLTVRDSAGAQATVTRDIVPQVVTLTLASDPSRLSLTLDGQPVESGHAFQSVIGMRRTIGAVTPQRDRGKDYVFDRWSDGGAATHTITTPTANTTYTAFFTRVKGGPNGRASRFVD
jgi:glucose/arabinose dehydrogenase